MLLTQIAQKILGRTEEDDHQIFRRIDRAKLGLMMEKNTTFFSSLLSNLKLILDYGHDTAATNGLCLWMNPYFVSKQNEDELIGLLLHETMHVALDHCNPTAYKGLNQYVLGIAMDHFINLFITGRGFTIPKNGYCDKKYIGWSSMQIYRDLMKNPPQPPPQWKPDVVPKPPDMSDEEYTEKVVTNLLKAALQAEMCGDPGSIPGDLLLKLKKLVAPELPWNLILLKYMDQYAKDDFSWSRPNKRYMPDFYLPCMRSEVIDLVFFGLDVSGSMTDGELEAGLAECRYIQSLLNPLRTHFMTFDTEVHLDKIYDQCEELPSVEIEGGGGTIIEPLIANIVKHKPLFAIIFTDGYFGAPDMTDVQSDIYWVIKGNPSFEAPKGPNGVGVGEVIHLN